MKIRYSIVCIALLILLAPSFPASAYSETTLSSVSQNCDSIKTGLHKLQVADTSTRIYLGGLYQETIDYFIVPLNLRLTKNSLISNSFVTSQKTTISEKDFFTRYFVEYSREFEGLLNADCRNNPTDFLDRLSATQTKRHELEKATDRMRDNFLTHRNLVVSLRSAL